jgi:hypothetical protein
VDERLEEVPGFGECQHCPFNTSGPAELCYACARQTMEPLADVRCMVCDRPFSGEDTTCRNPLCNRSSRSFHWNYAIAMRSGQLERAINRYKYRDRRGWALVFGRVLSGFLEEEAEVFRRFDVITASPTYTARGAGTSITPGSSCSGRPRRCHHGTSGHSTSRASRSSSRPRPRLRCRATAIRNAGQYPKKSCATASR